MLAARTTEAGERRSVVEVQGSDDTGRVERGKDEVKKARPWTVADSEGEKKAVQPHVTGERIGDGLQPRHDKQCGNRSVVRQATRATTEGKSSWPARYKYRCCTWVDHGRGSRFPLANTARLPLWSWRQDT
tara:strand:- start:15025 stop:15417 length:393 start_codon:yes stop_codon:yes gene_type:complete